MGEFTHFYRQPEKFWLANSRNCRYFANMFNRKVINMQYLGIFFFAGMVLEFFSLFWVASWLGGLTTFVLIILGFIVGGALLKNNLNVAKTLMAGQFLRGGMSFYNMLFPVRVPLAGFLLALPTGFLSSALGLLLLAPFPFNNKTDKKQSDIFSDTARQNGFEYTHHSKHQNQDDVIEGDYIVRNNKIKQNHDDIIKH